MFKFIRTKARRSVAAVRWVLGLSGIQTLAKAGELVGKCAIFVGIVSWLIEIPDRAEQKHAAAWSLINSAHGHFGDAGRSEAIYSLLRDNVSLSGIDLSNAYLPKIKLSGNLREDR